MKPKYPEILPWLAGKAGIRVDSVEVIWLEALRQATADCPVIESPDFWNSAMNHLFQGISLASLAQRDDALDRSFLPRLPTRYCRHSLATAESIFMSGLKATLHRQDHSGRAECFPSSRLMEAT